MTVSAEGHQEATALSDASDEELLAELVRRGAALRVGYCYPAMCSDEGNTTLVEEYGYEHGPWQFLELGHRPSGPPQWPMYAAVPPKFQRAVSDVDLGGPDGPIGPVSPPVISPARTVEVSDRTGRTDPDMP